MEKRQAGVLALATKGLSAQQIADTLILSRRTVEKHLETIYAHLGVKTRAQATAVAIAHWTTSQSNEPAPTGWNDLERLACIRFEYRAEATTLRPPKSPVPPRA
ncbi:MAG: response regulator transcription factor [Solirubrobacteraceae bacterium]